MRESIGGAWLFGIVILFIALFASFLAYSISYTRAFNTKNQIINLIEKNEGFTTSNLALSSDLKNKSDDELESLGTVDALSFLNIKNIGYNYTASEKIDCTTVGHANSSTQVGGYCITKYCSSYKTSTKKDPSSKVTYKVTTFVAVDIPVINVVVKIPISGETKLLYYDGSGMACDN